MSVYVRIPRRPQKPTATYKWEKYLAIHKWTCSEGRKIFLYNVYLAQDGQPMYDQLLRTEWLYSPFESGLSSSSQLEYYEYTGTEETETYLMYPVESTDRNAYPDDGSREGDNYEVYYYYFEGTEQGMYTGVTVSSDDENAYPSNGLHTDGYWYVKI